MEVYLIWVVLAGFEKLVEELLEAKVLMRRVL